jgi:sugar lactone lactonase YvrE
LANGFNNASGLTADAGGRLFFTDGTNHKIYRWNDVDRKAEQIGEIAGRPMVTGFVEPSTLVIVAHEKEVWSLNADEAGAVPLKIAETAERLPGTVLLLPVGLHNMLSVLNDLLENRDYEYRWGSNTAVIRVLENAPRGYFYAPGTSTALMAGGTWRPLLQNSSLAAFAPGDERFITSEDDGKTYRAKLAGDGRLETRVFAERGGTSVVSDREGNVYIAGGQIYIYDPAGKQLGILELPERPGSLAFGGPDHRTLFIGARGSLYSIRTKTVGSRE